MYGATLTHLEAGNVYRAVVPQKIPIGSGVNGTKKPGLFKVYVPSRDGPTLEVKTNSGTVHVFGPDGQPALAGARRERVEPGREVRFEVPDGQFGWFGIVVTDSTNYRVEVKMQIAGNSRDADGSMIVPWNFYYFPFSQVIQQGDNHPAMKWQKRFGGKAGDFERTSYWKSEMAGGDDGMAGHAITEEFVAEYNKWSGGSTKYSETDWWGHCDAAATASALFKQPNPSGQFSASDIEYFATEVAMRGYELEGRFHLGVGQGNQSRGAPANKEIPEDKLGQALDADIGYFHEAIVETIKKAGGIAISDLRAPKSRSHSEVWNQAIYKFAMDLKQARPDQGGGDEEASARALEVKAVLTANADFAGSEGNPETGNKWVRECYYTIHFDDKGKAQVNHPQNNYKKCTWDKTGEDYWAPRYIFQVKGLSERGNGKGNPHINLGNAQQLGLALRQVFNR